MTPAADEPLRAADEPEFELERPDRFVAAVQRQRYARELRSPRSLLILAGSLALGAVAATVMLEASAGLAAVGGLFGVLTVGRPIVNGMADSRAKRHARERLRAVLQERWTRDAEAVGTWGRRHGLAPIADAGFTAPLDTTPTLLEGAQADYANVLRGSVGEGTATFFHLTQLGAFPGRLGDDDSDAFRGFTCVHMKRERRDLVMTLHPRRANHPPCGLNRVSLSDVGDAWRAPGPDGRARPGSAEQGVQGAAAITRLVEAGWLPPQTIERMGEWESADDERRKALIEEFQREAVAWREREGAPRGFGAMVDMVRAWRDEGWREVKLESIAFNERYVLRTKDLDDLEVVGIFDPVMIVEMTEAVPADVIVEMHYDNLLVAMPGRVLESDLLDRLLDAAERVGRHVDDAPVPT